MLKDWHIMVASQDDAEEISTVMKSAKASLDDPSWFITSDTSRLFQKLENDCFGWVVREGSDFRYSDVVAYYLFQQPDSCMLPKEIGLSESELESFGVRKEEFGCSLILDTVAVMPSYQGFGLQRFLSKLGEHEGKNRGCHHFFATVHPDNRFSMNNFLALNYRVVATKYMFQDASPEGVLQLEMSTMSGGIGVPRNILYKHIV